MRDVIWSILLFFVAQARGEFLAGVQDAMDKLVDKLSGKLATRALKVLSSIHTDLDTTILAKPTNSSALFMPARIPKEFIKAPHTRFCCYTSTAARKLQDSHEVQESPTKSDSLNVPGSATTKKNTRRKSMELKNWVKNLLAPPEPNVTGFEGFPQRLDYGIYFFGPDNVPKKYKKGERNPFFSGENNILLLVHGWHGAWGLPGKVSKKYRETFNWKSNEPRTGPDVDLREAWVDNGWEVAAFYWDNFSDEAHFYGAEAKIWTNESSHGMRYWSTDGGFQTKDAPRVSAAELLRQGIEGIMSDCKHSKIQLRLVGHSMGAQMVIRASYLQAARVEKGLVPKSYMPSRIALVDPFWSHQTAQWLDKDVAGHGKNQTSKHVTTAFLSLGFATHLAEKFGVLFEIYTSCPVITDNPLFTDPMLVRDLVMQGHAAQVQLSPDFCPVWDVWSRHVSALDMYLWSMTFEQRISPTASIVNGAPCAAMSDQLLKRIRGSQWVQESGESPCNDSNFCFREKAGAGGVYGSQVHGVGKCVTEPDVDWNTIRL